MFEIKGLKKSYGKQKVLDDINFKLFQNNITCLLGNNGSGKTTLINTIIGISNADSGKAFL
jgi:ABC-type multidrug transport system ATPase subunit